MKDDHKMINDKDQEFVTGDPSEWYCELCGSDVIYKPISIKIPNWFHRQMQHLFFGFKWRKKMKKLTKEIIALSRKKTELIKEVEVLKAALEAGNKELKRRKNVNSR